MNRQNNQVNININPEDCEKIACTNCSSNFFLELNMMLKVPALISPTGQDFFVKQPLMVCSRCGKPLDDSLKEIQEGDEAKTKENLILS